MFSLKHSKELAFVYSAMYPTGRETYQFVAKEKRTLTNS